MLVSFYDVYIDVRENRRINEKIEEWTIQRHWQYLTHRTKHKNTTQKIKKI
jgi:hypothetical protein